MKHSQPREQAREQPRKQPREQSRKQPRETPHADHDTHDRHDRRNTGLSRFLPHILRILVSVVLVYLSWPPISMGLVNIYVILPAIAGVAVLLWPLQRLALQRLGERRARRISRVLLGLVLAGLIALGISFGFIVSASTPTTVPDGAVVIVLGAQVINGQPSTILSGRIRAAAEYLEANDDAICIASGGQGPDESKSEAAAIRDTLIEVYNIAPDRILLEDRSTSTRENLMNSLLILDAEGLPRNVLIATDAYHMYRAKKIATALEMTPYPLPAATDNRLVVPMTLREMLAIWADFVRPM